MLTAESLISFNETINWHIWLHWAVSLLILSLSNVFFFPAIGREGGRNSAAPAIIDPQSEHIWRLSSADLFRFKKLKKKTTTRKTHNLWDKETLTFNVVILGNIKEISDRGKKRNPFTNCRVHVRNETRRSLHLALLRILGSPKQ